MVARVPARLRLAVATVAGVAAIALTVSLGNWQTRRGDAKAALQAQWDAAAAAAPVRLQPADLAPQALALPRRVRAEGRFVPAANLYLDNRQLDGVAGFFVLTPLELAPDAPLVLVNRGFLPRDPQDRARLAPVPLPAGEQAIEGLALAQVPQLLELGSGAEQRVPGIWQNLDYGAFERALGRPVARLVVQQTSESADGLRRAWVAPSFGIEKHRGYAFQWYALAATLAALTLWFGGRAWWRAR